MTMTREIKFFSVEDEKKYEKPYIKWSCTESVIYLDLFSKKSAVLINEVINWKVNDSATRRRCAGAVGGLFVKCHAEVVISTIGEVGLKFEERGDDYIKKYIRTANGISERLIMIKDKLANELKKFWNTHEKSINAQGGKFKRVLTVNETTEEFEFTETDYRILYEILKNRNTDKLIAKYSKVKFDEMHGNKIEDMFILTAIETIKSEISQIIDNKEAALKQNGDEYNENQKKLRNHYEEARDQIIQTANEKIKELQEQIINMKNMGNLMAAGYTF